MAFGEEGFEERTEEATPQKREEWRDEGRVVQSKELVGSLLMLALVGSLYAASQWSLKGVWYVFETSFNEIGRLSKGDWTPGTVMSMGFFALRSAAYILAPLALAAIVASTGGTLIQTGFVWTSKPLQMDPDKINPMNGLGRMFGLDGVVEMVKAILKFTVIGTVVFFFIKKRLAEAGNLWGLDPAGISHYLGTQLLATLLTVAFAMTILAGLDFGYQKFRYEQKIRMTKQEVREERRQSDGNPQIKSRIRSLQRRVSQNKMIDAVKTADVVITNPTHIAVALVYDRENMFAPKVVAKGADYMAERIKKVARENGVPCVENVPLARALFKALKIGQFISRDLFNAVAEVLAYVYRLKGKTQI